MNVPFKRIKDKITNFDWAPKRERKHRDATKTGSVISAVRDSASMPKTDTIKHAAERMISLQTRRVFLTDTSDRIEGIVTCRDFMDFLGGGDKYNLIKVKHNRNLVAAMNEPVREIMTQTVSAIKSNESLKNAIKLMQKSGHGGMPVEHEGKLVGMITEKRVVNLISKSFTGQLVKDYMSKNVIFGTPGETLLDISKTMTRNSFRRLPIIQEGKLVGMITSKDLVFAFVKKFSRDFLETRVSTMMNKPVTISSEATLVEAAKIMRNNNVSGLPVLFGEKVIGMITAKDLIKAVNL
jgi:CBS domain-containing protein